MTGIALAQNEAPQNQASQNEGPQGGASQSSLEKALKQAEDVQINPSDLPGMVEKILQTYKEVLAQSKPILDAADVQLPKELLEGETDLAAPAKQGDSTQKQAQATKLETGGLTTGTLKTGGLPLTLPNVEPTTEPIEQYQMWRKAGRDKAIRDRYLELRGLAAPSATPVPP